MLKTGIVLQSNKVSTHIITSDSEFIKLKTKNNKAPRIGEIYTSESYEQINIFYIVILSLLIISVISFLTCEGINIIKKNTTYYSVVIELNSSVHLEVNKANEIIKVEPLNNKGSTLVKDLNLNHKNLDETLTILLEKANKLGYLDGYYSKKDKPICIYITTHKDTLVSLVSFNNKANELKLTVLVNDNGN